MSYQPGKMGLAGGMAFVFIPNLAPAFLSLTSMSADRMATATWMTPILHFPASITVLYLLLYVLKHTSGDLYAASQALLGTTFTRLIALYYSGVFFLEAGLLIRQFAENTLLTALPQIDLELAIALYAIMAVFLVYLGIEALARSAYIVFPFIIFGVVFVLILLIPQYHPLYLTPWNGRGITSILSGTFQVSGIDLPIIIPAIMASSFQNTRTVKHSVLYGLGISAVMKSITLMAGTAVYGVMVGREKVLPFYEITRLIYINRFVQHLEAFFIVLWTIVGMLTIALEIYVGIYLLGRLFNLPTLRPLIAPVVLILAELSMLPGDLASVIIFHGQAEAIVYNIGLYIIPVVLFLAAVYRVWRSKA